MNAGQMLQQLNSQIKNDSTELDAQIILAHVLGRQRGWVLAHLETNLSQPQADSALRAFDEFQSGTPLPYIIGHWEFFGLDFDITNDVLIPRPETEVLVEKAITWLRASPERRTVADIGTGSGAIATSIAVHVPNVRILSTDISLPALKVAQHNARKFQVQRIIDLLQCDLLPKHVDPLPTDRHFDLVCANLPYIPTATLKLLPIFGREPTIALDGGTDGLDQYRRLFKLAPDWLAPGGMMLLETESTLGVKALSLAFDTFADATIHLHQDLAGNDRLLEIMFR